MKRRLSLYALMTLGPALWALVGSAWAQQTPLPSNQQPAAQAAQQIPQHTAQQTRQDQPAVPFTLTEEEQKQVDAILKQWESHNKKIETFDCRFERWTYDTVFGQSDGQGNMPARFIDLGCLRYKAPGSGAFQVDMTKKADGTEVPIDDNRAEHWVCDGKSIYEFKHPQKKLIEHQLPPEVQGKALANTPLPFLFGAEAVKLKERYWIRIITPKNAQNQIWLEAWPKHQQEAANFRFAQFIIDATTMNPFGLMLRQPNGKDYTTYQFWEIVVNNPFRIFKLNDPLNPRTPFGWTKTVEPAMSAQPQGQPPAAQPSAQARQQAGARR